MSTTDSPGPWTFARVLGLLSQKRKSGILQVVGPDGELRIHIRDGTVTEVETRDAASWKLGDFLVESGTVAQNELLRESRRAAKGQVPLETALLQRRLVTEDVLRRFVELHIRETVFPLFSKTGITCRLEEVPPRDNPYLTPIPLGFFLKTAQKRTDAWPRLLARIPHEEIAFDKVDAFVPVVLGQGGGLPLPDGADPAPIGGNERVVYYYVNGRKTVRQLAYASCLGEFETYSALVRLFDLGLVEVVAEHGRGDRLRSRRRLLPGLARIVAYGLAGATVAALALARPGALKDPAALVSFMPPAQLRRLSVLHRGRVEAALEAFRLTTGHYPEQLSALTDASLLDADALSPPLWDKAWTYCPADAPASTTYRFAESEGADTCAAAGRAKPLDGEGPPTVTK